MTGNSDHIDGTRVTIRIPALQLESGEVLQDAPIVAHTWGRLNEECDNCVLICHALTGNSNVHDWWPGIVGPGKAIDTERYYVVCANVPGSPYGSVSPLTVDPATGRSYGASFPAITIRDTVFAHRQLLDSLGVRRVAAAVGASMGGMQVLEWAFHGEFVQTLIPVAVGGRHSAWCIAWSEAQRQAIYTDPDWKDGRYTDDRRPESGLATARMMAMISYRSQHEFAQRFGRSLMPVNGAAPLYAAESYLRHQGKKLVRRFDANCYVHLTHQMDSHDVARGRGEYEEVLRSIEQPTLVVGITTDVLYPLDEQRELVDLLPRAQLEILEAPYGHDSFLIETDRMSELIEGWLDRHHGAKNLSAGRAAPRKGHRLSADR